MKIQINTVYTREKKLNKIKVGVFIVLMASVILFCASDYIMYKIKQLDIHENVIEEAKASNIPKEITEDIDIVEIPPEDEDVYIPVMTEKGMENFKHIYASEYKRAFLTFDDGPSLDITPKILDILKEEDIKATFFVLGTMAEYYPEIVRREYEEGHYIGNHGYSHVYSKIYESAEAVLDEYNRTNEAISNALGIEGYETHLFRFPGGSVGGYDKVKNEAKDILRKRNIAYVDWNALTRDSEGYFSTEKLLENLRYTVQNKMSVVILCHDASGKKTTYESLKDVINYLRESGYTFANMKDLVE